jgi:hypothetical protein
MTQYREVKRQANVGDRIKIVNTIYAGSPPVYRDGDVVIVTSVEGGGDCYIDRKWPGEDNDALVYAKEYVVLEPVTTQAPQTIAEKRVEIARLQAEVDVLLAEARPKVGEYVRVINASDSDRFFDGDVGIVSAIDSLDEELPFKVRKVGDRVDEWPGEWFADVERVTPEEARAAVIAQAEALFAAEEARRS